MEDVKRAGYNRLDIGEAALSHNYSKMSDSTGNNRKIYVEYPKGKSKIYLAHGPGH